MAVSPVFFLFFFSLSLYYFCNARPRETDNSSTPPMLLPPLLQFNGQITSRNEVAGVVLA